MFNQGQIAVIEQAAKNVKNQGEMAVYSWLVKYASRDVFSETQMNVLRYITEECRRQRSGEMSVRNMTEAWTYADTAGRSAFFGSSAADLISLILDVGGMVEPNLNKGGYRKTAVGIRMPDGVFHEKIPWTAINRQMNLLADSFCEGHLVPINPIAKTRIDQFYYEFEEIHPFRDGNGRTGKIIYNKLNNTMNQPIVPPLFWEGSIP